MKNKRCIHCLKYKPISEYYAHPQMPDGHLNKCKPCCCVAARLNRSMNLDYYRAYDTFRYRTKGRRGQHYIKEHSAANRKVFRALKSGVLKKQPCEVCGAKTTQGHHDDYSKPLQVRWLCVKHHWRKHRQF